MSILSFPRINFQGVFRTNPCTTNNDDVMPDVVLRDSDDLGPTLRSMADTDIKAFLRQSVTMQNDDSWPCHQYIRSGWNLYGDFATTFENTVVTSVLTGPNQAAPDPLVGKAVRLLGGASQDPMRRGPAMICDLDPTGLITSQLWLGGLQIGDAAAPSGSGNVIVGFDHDTRAFQDWLNFASTLGTSNPSPYGLYGGEQNFVGIGCIWQFAIPASAIPANVSFVSPGLQALLAAGRQAAGLVVRFRCWEVQPTQVSATMAAAFQKGNAIDNPAEGYLVGTIGVWEHGEPETEPAGRKLTPPYPRDVMQWSWDGLPATTVKGGPLPWQAPPALIGNAVALVQPASHVVSLDLVNSLPKGGFRDPNGPSQGSPGFDAPRTRANVGQIELAVIPAGGGAAVPIGPIDYGLTNYSTYEDYGGIVDVRYSPSLAETIASGTLIIRGTQHSDLNAGTLMLQESPIRVVTDDRGVYSVLHGPSPAVRIKVFERGGPPLSDTTIYLNEYFQIVQPQTKPGPCSDGVRPNQTVSQSTNGILQFPPAVTIPAGATDWFTVPITLAGSGATLLAYQTSPVPFGDGSTDGVTGVPVWSTADYSAIRVFSVRDYSALDGANGIQWADVYQQVLRFYYLIYPAMSRIIPLNMPDSILQYADLISQRLNTPDQPGFYTTYNMPPTRTMPPAKVKLLLDFIAQQQKRQSVGS